MRKIGLFGGAFNPIHIGHIKMAEAAQREYKLSHVYFIPCGIPPHKPKKEILPAQARCELVKKAIRGNKSFSVLDIEIKKKKKTYTLNTVKEIRETMLSASGTHSGASLIYFLIGQDEFEKLHTWYKANELAKLVKFLVFPRVRDGASKAEKIKPPSVENLNWSLVHAKPVNISSTEIRNKIKKMN